MSTVRKSYRFKTEVKTHVVTTPPIEEVVKMLDDDEKDLERKLRRGHRTFNEHETEELRWIEGHVDEFGKEVKPPFGLPFLSILGHTGSWLATVATGGGIIFVVVMALNCYCRKK